MVLRSVANLASGYLCKAVEMKENYLITIVNNYGKSNKYYVSEIPNVLLKQLNIVLCNKNKAQAQQQEKEEAGSLLTE